MEIEVNGLTEKEVKAAIKAYIRKKNKDYMDLDPTIIKSNFSRLSPGEMVLVKKDDNAGIFGNEFREVKCGSWRGKTFYTNDPDNPEGELFHYPGGKVFYVLKDIKGPRRIKKEEENKIEIERGLYENKTKAIEKIKTILKELQINYTLEYLTNRNLISMKILISDDQEINLNVRSRVLSLDDWNWSTRLSLTLTKDRDLEDIYAETLKYTIKKERERYINENTI